jgi:hypothetical protein
MLLHEKREDPTLKALRKLDNAIRTTVGPLATFNPENPEWSAKEA